MEAYVSVLNYAIPFFFILLLFEAAVAWRKNAAVIRSMDTLSSLSSGITNAIKDVLGLTIVIVSYGWLEEKIGIFDIQSTLLVYIIAFIGLDFAGYCVHLLSHKVNYFWNRHIVHHSSEEFNLGCALRQSISGFFAITVFFLVPVAILGVPESVIAIIAPLHLFAQYWYHTRLIGKMGILEKILVTPSHHRVHHAINKEYLDKNLSQIFIIWDKLFGTFQEELDDVPPIYGVTRPVRTWNPITINFMHLWTLIQDAWRTRFWKDKFRIWFMPTGWRPADVKEKYPISIISDIYTYKKYNPEVSTGLKWWSWIQFTFVFLAMMHLFNRLADISFSQAILYGGFLFLSIYSYSLLMDKSRHAWWLEAVKSAIGIAIIIVQGGWFLIDEWIPYGDWLVGCYFVLSAVMVYYFTTFEIHQNAPLSLKTK